jgi:predicted ATP-dependent endonuclease of OLD family
MHIKHITVKNFRCFENLEFDLNPDINIFVGNNGSGKSTVLDAIAAAMYPYIKDIQRIVEKETDDIPFFYRIFPSPKLHDPVIGRLPSWQHWYHGWDRAEKGDR